MNSLQPDLVVCCNGAEAPENASAVERLEYAPGAADRNMRIGLPDFVAGVFHIPDRMLDLLEIAAYVFAADRLSPRGRKDQVEYQSWSRHWLFRILVRDHAFWSQSSVREALQESLRFMTGDADYLFEFLPGHRTAPTNLFDDEQFSVNPEARPVRVTLFSGGLDSLAGALKILEETSSGLVLVSHESQPGTVRTQRRLVEALQARFPGRVSHYRFVCQLSGVRAQEETQRTRSLLYCSVGFAIAQAYGHDELDVFENGVTSINLHRREDLVNGRASRTTHPKTLRLLGQVFSLIAEKDFRLSLPFLWQTKRAVIDVLRDTGSEELIASSVSCSRTFQREGAATHCGRCFQCVDRRIAVHSAHAETSDDPGLYSTDIFRTAIVDREARTTAIDYVRQAAELANSNVDSFAAQYLVELSDVVESVNYAGGEFERVEAVWELMARHASDVKGGLAHARDLYDDMFGEREPNSLLGLVASREHLKEEVERCVASLLDVLVPALGEHLARNRPKDEGELNSLVGAMLRSHHQALVSEHPTVCFAGARVIPDHELADNDVLVEAKYIRGATSPARASEGMAADLTKYPQTSHILFLVHDPDRAIAHDGVFIRDFESRGRCTVQLIR